MIQLQASLEEISYLDSFHCDVMPEYSIESALLAPTEISGVLDFLGFIIKH